MEQGKNELFLRNADWTYQSQKHVLTKIANAYPSEAEPDSRYRRMQRFIHDYPVNFDTVARFLMKLFNFLHERFYITLDRTHWKWGKMNLNILVLALVY